jgi:cell division protein FtsB
MVKTTNYHPNREIVRKTEKKVAEQKRQVGFYYSFLTLVLLFCLIQIGWGMILNISKMVAYRAKVGTLQKILTTVHEQNKKLKEDVSVFSSTSSIEGIARNNLKMAGHDEVLIIINEQQNAEENKKR